MGDLTLGKLRKELLSGVKEDALNAVFRNRVPHIPTININ